MDQAHGSHPIGRRDWTLGVRAVFDRAACVGGHHQSFATYSVAFAGLLCLMCQRLDRLGIILLVSLFLLQPILTGYFIGGRPDHHSLILAILSWFLVGLH